MATPLVSETEIIERDFELEGLQSQVLSHINEALRIRILYSDQDIIVIYKPSGLRSVPGHAESLPSLKLTESRKRRRNEGSPRANKSGSNEQENDNSTDTIKQGSRRTSHEAWVCALEAIAAETIHDSSGNTGTLSVVETNNLLRRLTAKKTYISSIPRKFKVFQRYVLRNQLRLFPCEEMTTGVEQGLGPKSTGNGGTTANKQQHTTSEMSKEEMEMIINLAFHQIQERQRQYMNLPEATTSEQSALGQLSMLIDAKQTNGIKKERRNHCSGSVETTENRVECNTKLHVVHRLDCDTSGVMVFARTSEAASFLARLWRREGATDTDETVQKTYIAQVRSWPPFTDTKIMKGQIDLPLAPSQTERLKWEVVSSLSAKSSSVRVGKASQTHWAVIAANGRVLDTKEDISGGDFERHLVETLAKRDDKLITLKLIPVTGRTHQLRIHCAAVGSAIVGDRLYGDENGEEVGTTTNPLHLHAYRLSFPHPRTRQRISFDEKPRW